MGSAVGEITGANRRAARAAGRAAMQQQATAREFGKQQEALIGDVKKAFDDPQALLANEQALKAQERSLVRQEELAESINPALKQAALQAAGLLRGEEAAALGPLRNQRQQARQDLLNTLREQLGPGAETSSAGQQALNRFDSETSTILGGAQQQSLNTLLQTTLASRPDIGGAAAGLSNQANVGLNRALSFGGFASGARQAAFNPQFQSAGADQVQNLIRAQQGQAIGGEAFSGALQLASAGLAGGAFGALGGAAPAASGGAGTIGQMFGISGNNLPTLK